LLVNADPTEGDKRGKDKAETMTGEGTVVETHRSFTTEKRSIDYGQQIPDYSIFQLF
jgi:hypothetical protein